MKSKNPKPNNSQEFACKEVTSKRINKQQIVIEMLKSKEGACLDEMVEATGWQKHSVRGIMAGSLKKKLGLNIQSEIRGNARVYFIVPEPQNIEVK